MKSLEEKLEEDGEERSLPASSIEAIRSGTAGGELWADGIDEKMMEFALKHK